MAWRGFDATGSMVPGIVGHSVRTDFTRTGFEGCVRQLGHYWLISLRCKTALTAPMSQMLPRRRTRPGAVQLENPVWICQQAAKRRQNVEQIALDIKVVVQECALKVTHDIGYSWRVIVVHAYLPATTTE